MTYEEIYERLSRKERFVTRQLMSRMKYDESGFWTACLWNKMIHKLANRILGYESLNLTWRIGFALGDGVVNLALLKEELDWLKEALA